MKSLNHLEALEGEAIQIMREVAACFESSRMLYSIHKNQAGSNRSCNHALISSDSYNHRSLPSSC